MAAQLIEDIVLGRRLDKWVMDGRVDSLYNEVMRNAVQFKPISVNSSFFNLLLSEMTKLMGPIAEDILEQEIQILGLSRSEFPRDRVPELLANIGEMIADADLRAQFQRSVLASIGERP